VEPGKDDLQGWRADMQRGAEQVANGITPDVKNTLITIAIIAVVVLLVLVILGIIARYVSETSLIRMVNDYEEKESLQTVRQGLRMGWSRTAWKLFLIDLLINIPVGLAFLVLLLIAATPLLLWTTENTLAGIIGTVTTSGFFFLLIVLAIVSSEVIRLIKHFARRECALDEQGVWASISKGYALARRHLKDVGLMWLVTAAVRFVWPVATIPVAFLLMLAGILTGGILALIVGGIATLVASATTAWVVGGVTGGVIFMLVLILPLIFFAGLREVFLSSTWTLTYRQLRALQVPAPLPQVDTQASQAAV
jgi:hypothetical protein